MHSFYAALGRFAVRFRWVIVVAWVAAAVPANLFLPSLASVAKQDNAVRPRQAPGPGVRGGPARRPRRRTHPKRQGIMRYGTSRRT